jgi:hypothetical protein
LNDGLDELYFQKKIKKKDGGLGRNAFSTFVLAKGRRVEVVGWLIGSRRDGGPVKKEADVQPSPKGETRFYPDEVVLFGLIWQTEKRVFALCTLNSNSRFHAGQKSDAEIKKTAQRTSSL